MMIAALSSPNTKIGGIVLAASASASPASISRCRFSRTNNHLTKTISLRGISDTNDNNDDNIGTTRIEIPPATWSIKELDLSARHPLVSKEELLKLSQRAVLDPGKLSSSDGLRQDLGNMMHMIQQVSSFQQERKQQEQENNNTTDTNPKPVDASAIYDAPRGVASAPLRRSRKNEPATTEDEIRDTQSVWENMLKPKTTAIGGHRYFIIKTAAGDEKKKE